MGLFLITGMFGDLLKIFLELECNYNCIVVLHLSQEESKVVVEHNEGVSYRPEAFQDSPHHLLVS